MLKLESETVNQLPELNWVSGRWFQGGFVYNLHLEINNCSEPAREHVFVFKQ